MHVLYIMHGLEGIHHFTALNKDSKKLAICRVREVLSLIVSILYFGKASKRYANSLVDIATEFIECIFLPTDSFYPTIKKDSVFLNLLERFNVLQKKEEEYMRVKLNHRHGIEPMCPPPVP